MTKDLDEDLIEATIRRVAEAKAARAAGTGQTADPESPAVAPAAVPEGSHENPTPAVAPSEAWPSHAPTPSARADDARIAETIRRVAEAKAAPAAARCPATSGRGAGAMAARAADARAVAPPPVVERSDATDEQAPATARPTPIRGAEAPASTPPGVDTAALLELVAELRQELAATRSDVRELAARFEAARDSAGDARSVTGHDDDDWDDAPQLPRVPLGQAPRPAILRDPSPMAATAEHLVESEPETIIDTRPLPKPLPPLHAEPKRGLDLLPRTYRITVEDKRRGVDLVTLHRALLGMDGVRDMSLLSYSNGVAIVAVEMIDELDPQALESAVTRAMSRGAKVEVHNDTTMVVKLAEE